MVGLYIYLSYSQVSFCLHLWWQKLSYSHILWSQRSHTLFLASLLPAAVHFRHSPVLCQTSEMWLVGWGHMLNDILHSSFWLAALGDRLSLGPFDHVHVNSNLKSPDVEDFLCVCMCSWGVGYLLWCVSVYRPCPGRPRVSDDAERDVPQPCPASLPYTEPNTCCFCWCCCCSCSWYDPLTYLCLHMVHSTHHHCQCYIPHPFLHWYYIHLRRVLQRWSIL